MKTHFSATPICCQFCQKTFKTKQTLDKHTSKYHSENKDEQDQQKQQDDSFVLTPQLHHENGAGVKNMEGNQVCHFVTEGQFGASSVTTVPSEYGAIAYTTNFQWPEYKYVEELVQEQGKPGTSNVQAVSRQNEIIACNTNKQWSDSQPRQKQSESCIMNTDVEMTPCTPSERFSQRFQSAPMSYPMGAQFQMTPALTSDASSGMSSNPIPLPNTHHQNPQQDQHLGNQEELQPLDLVDFVELVQCLEEKEDRMASKLMNQEVEITT